MRNLILKHIEILDDFFTSIIHQKEDTETSNSKKEETHKDSSKNPLGF